jgi:SNF2 family DNA or RNA helicase
MWVQEPKPWKPHGYQKKAVKFLLEHACAALFLDPGLGKTSITLAAVSFLKKKKVLNKVLLIAPLRVAHSVWPGEIEKWTDFSGLKVVVLHGPEKESLLLQNADVYVINPEGLDWLFDVKKTKTLTGKVQVSVNLKTRFSKISPDTLVIDELTKFKHTTSARFKILKVVTGKFARRWGLTGSPAANGLMGLFGQCYVLDEGNALGKYVTKFKTEFFEPIDPQRFKWVPREGAEEKLFKKVSPLALRMSSEDYLELPELNEIIHKIELPKEAMDAYHDLEDDLILELGDDSITAINAAVLSGKCRQAASGAIYKDKNLEALVLNGFPLPTGKDAWVKIHDEKITALESLVDELQGQPLLVAYEFAHELQRFQDIFGKDVPYIGGGVSPKKSKELEKLWNRGELPILFGHPQAIALGLNLQESGRHVCWYTTTWDYELYDQLNRRVWRQGNKSKSVFIHHIVAKGTIDEAVMRSIRSKKKGQNEFFQALKDLRSKRRK